MAGISSRAAGALENKKKYNGIEFDNDLDINTYEAFFRNLDPQTGRWWQIDPETEDQEMWSPYTSNNDNPILYKDPRGNEGEECCGGLWDAVKKSAGEVKALVLGAANAWGSDQVLGAGNKSAEEAGFTGDEATFYNAGQTTGHGAAVITGAIESVAGAGSEVLTVGGSTVVSVPLTLHGASTVATAFSKLLTQGTSAGTRNPKVKEAVEKGNAAHKDFSEKAKAKGYDVTPSLKDPLTGKTVKPDAVTKSGKPLELKPNTTTGKAKGAAQLPKYERATGQKGRVVTYDPNKY